MNSDAVVSAHAKITRAENQVLSLTRALMVCATKKRAHLIVERNVALTKVETAQKHLADVLIVETANLAAKVATKVAANLAAKAAANLRYQKMRLRKMRSSRPTWYQKHHEIDDKFFDEDSGLLEHICESLCDDSPNYQYPSFYEYPFISQF